MKETGKCDSGKKQSIEIVFEGTQMFDLADRYLKTAIINMFKELKGTIFKELKKKHVETDSSNREYQSRDGNYNKEPNKNSGIVKSSNQNEKFARGAQQQI